MLSAELTVLCQMAANQIAFNRHILKNTAILIGQLDGKDRDLVRVVAENQTRQAEADYQRKYLFLVNEILRIVESPGYEQTLSDTKSKEKEISELFERLSDHNDDELPE